MTKENLIDLYNIISKLFPEEKGLDKDTINSIQRLTDHDVLVIKRCHRPLQMFRLLSNINFKTKYSEELQNRIIATINESKLENYTEVVNAALALTVSSYTDDEIVTIIDLIGQAKGEGQAQNAAKIVNPTVLTILSSDSKRLTSMVKTITTCKNMYAAKEIASYLLHLVEYPNILSLNSTLKIIKSIANEKDETRVDYGISTVYRNVEKLSKIENEKELVVAGNKVARYVSMITTEKSMLKAESLYNTLNNSILIERGLEYEIAMIIKDAELHNARLAKNVATNQNTLNLPDDTIKELVTIVAKADKIYQCDYAAKIATDETVIGIELVSKKIICDLARAISKSAGEDQAMYAYKVGSNKETILNAKALLSGVVLSMVETISQASSPYKAAYAANFAMNGLLLQSGIADMFTKKAVKIEDNERLCFDEIGMNTLIDHIRSRIEDVSINKLNQLFELFDVYVDLWELFQRDHKAAIDALGLDGKILNQDDINPKTKVRVRNYKDLK